MSNHQNEHKREQSEHQPKHQSEHQPEHQPEHQSEHRSECNYSASYDLRRLEDKLDKMLGFYYWRTYWATSLWTNISSPLNFSITIFTALMATHSSMSNGGGLISDQMNMTINLSTFLLSTVNSFYTPQKEANELNAFSSEWMDCGNQFEKVVYSELSMARKIEEYQKILDTANELRKKQYSSKRNFITDGLHMLIKKIFMNNNDRWMSSDNNIAFYRDIQEQNIELDFDLQSLMPRKKHKKTSMCDLLCGCFRCCICNKSDKDEDTDEPVSVSIEMGSMGGINSKGGIGSK